MTSQEQINLFASFTAAQKKVFSAKGDDYAGQEDRLSNFKFVGAICGLRPEVVALVHVATKVARLCTLFKHSERPKNESISDSVLDMGNYTFLLQCLIEEQKKPIDGVVIAPGVEVKCVIDSEGQQADGINLEDTVIVTSVNGKFVSFHGKRYLHCIDNFTPTGSALVNF